MVMKETNISLKNSSDGEKDIPTEIDTSKEDKADINENDESKTELPDLPLTVYTPKNHTIKIALLAIFTALGIALSSIFISFPYLEFMTLTLFIGGIILGPLYGSYLALLSEALYEIIATAMIGPGAIIFPFKIIAFLMIALTGSMVGRKMPIKISIFRRLFLAVLGGLLTIVYDLIVNIGWVLISNDFQFIGYFTALIIGLPVTASKVAANAILFFFIPDILNRSLISLRSKEQKTIRKLELD